MGGGAPPSPGGDDSDNSDSDPEPDMARHPRRWRSWVRRQERERARQEFGSGRVTVTTQSDSAVEKPKTFKGDPEDLTRFLIQLENKFQAEKKKYASDLSRIRYAANLFEGKVAKWYESYHLQISPKDALRVRGTVDLDPKFATWDYFEASLRSSFGQRITRDQALVEWRNLRHTDSIDDFLDSLTRLMWRTGYEGDVVEDKIKEALNPELAMDWAKTRKPRELSDQLAMLRDMGHQMEDHYRTRRSKGSGEKPSKTHEKKTEHKRQSTSGPSKPREKGKSSGSGERKNKDVELKGIPQSLLDERKKDGNCLKCGKGRHMWYDCYTADPVTHKVAAGSKRKGGPLADRISYPKRARVAGVKEAEAAPTPGRILQVATEEDSDLDIWAL